MRANYSGLIIAGAGFFLTRFTVALALYEDPLQFYLGGIVPLVLGLGLAAFGVALVVADVEASLVRTTANWCIVGAGTMLVLVVLTLAATNPGGVLDIGTVQSQTYLSNFLIGGSVGGTLTGLYAATNRRQRVELHSQANRLEVLNRLLRHEVLNSVTVIKGYASLPTGEHPETWDVIEDRSDAIERTIDEVKYLARDARASSHSTEAVDVEARLDAGIELIRRSHPAAEISVGALPTSLFVQATDRLDRVFFHLLEEAVARSTADEPEISVTVSSTATRVLVDIRYDGLPFPEKQRALLERGEIGRFDDPGMGFNLHVVRLFVDNYGGTVETDAKADGATITVGLPRATSEGARHPASGMALTGLLPSVPHLGVGLGAALIAGVVYGIISETLGGSIAGIGVFYGTVSPVVGWITHEFHSIVFGFVFLGLVAQAPGWFHKGFVGHVVIGVIWAVTLWVFAAGFIAPVWLQLVGISASIPSFSWELLLSHLGWGISLGLLTAWGQQHLLPRTA